MEARRSRRDRLRRHGRAAQFIRESQEPLDLLEPLHRLEDLVAHQARSHPTAQTKSKLRFWPLLRGALLLAAPLLHIALDGGGHAADGQSLRQVRGLKANDVGDIAK